MNKYDDKIYDWHLYDYFDTIVHRKCPPEATKMLWAKKMAKKFNINELTAEIIWRVRIESEKEIQEKHKFESEPSYNVLVIEMYERLYRYIGEVDKDLFYQCSLNVEIIVECEVQYIDEEMIMKIKELKAVGASIAIVSDFYLPETAFMTFLSYLGIDILFDRIFISCEYDARKSDGLLYDIVLCQLQCSSKCCMTGDNYISDYIIPRKKGIISYHKEFFQKSPKLGTSSIIEKQLIGLKKNLKNKGVPFSGYVFYFYQFIDTLYNELVLNQVSDIFFLSREGQPLKKLFEKYLEYKDDNCITAHYLYASRASTMIAAMDILECEKFDNFFKEYKDVCPLDFFYSLGFTEKNCLEICLEANVIAYEVIHNFRESKEFFKLSKTKIFQFFYEEKRQEQKREFTEYLKTFEIDYTKNGLYLVDVGWKGTIQDNIYKILERKVKLTGYYTGLNGKTFCEKNNIKKGLVFSYYPIKSPYCEWYEQFTFLTEQLLSADHGPTLGYIHSVEKAKPILSDDKENEMIYSLVKNIQKQWLDSFDVINDIFRYSCFSSKDFTVIFATIHLQNILLKTKEERRLKEKLKNDSSNNFGHITGLKVNKNFYSKIKYFVKNVKSTHTKKEFKILYGLEDITRKLHCSWLDGVIEWVIYYRILLGDKRK